MSKSLQHEQCRLASKGRPAERIGDGDDCGACGSGRVGCPRDPWRKTLDRRGLRDIERFAMRRSSVVVDQTNVRRCATPRERVREQAADLAGSDDRDLSHLSCAIVMARMETLRGKVALVTGGSRGIGLAIARALVADGVQVSVTARSEAHLSAARARIESAGPAAVETLRADVRHYDEIERAVGATVGRFGGLDILINNAGIGIFADVAEMTPAQWSEIMDTNLTGVFNACHAAIPHLRRRGGGSIINISSLASTSPFVRGAAYCASKAGLNAFSDALMQEVRYDDIRVSCVLPGSVATEFAQGDSSKGAEWKVAPVEVAEVVLNLLRHPARSLPSRVELRPTRPPRK